MWPMNCFGRSRCHLICITQEIRYHSTGHTINQQVWKPETLLNSSCLFVVFNYKASLMPALFAVVSIWQLEEPNSRKSMRLNMPAQAALTLTCCDQPFTTVSLMPAWYIPDIRLETAEDTCMTLDSYRWLDACVRPDSFESWTCGRCGGVMWPMNCFGRSRCHLICITQEIRYHRTGRTINQ